MNSDAPITILLVDDEAVIAMATKMALEGYGYRVLTAFSGEKAVQAFKKMPDVDLILMDINLGAGMDGTEAAGVIMAERDLPVVFLSSHTEPEIVAKTEKITSYGYVVKDSSVTVLDASIKMALKLYRAKQGEMAREKQAEAALGALRESEAKFRGMAEQLEEVLYTTDQDGVITYISSSSSRVFGWRPEEMLGQRFFEYLPETEIPQALKAFRSAIVEGLPSRMLILRMKRKGGGVFLGEVMGSPMKKDGGGVGTVGLIRDITERARAEEELAKRNRYIESILDNMPIGFAANTIDEGTAVYLNLRFTEIYGWSKEALTGVDSFFEKVYPGPEGPELKARVLSDIMSGDPKRMAWDDLKITTSSGEHRYISARNIPILDQNLMVSTVWDTTRMHDSLEALRDSEERYRSIFQASSDAMLLTAPDGAILAVNPAACRIFGRTEEEILRGGRSGIVDLTDPRLAAGLEERARTGRFNGELTFLRGNGERFPGEITSVVFRDKDGLERTSMIIRDATKRR